MHKRYLARENDNKHYLYTLDADVSSKMVRRMTLDVEPQKGLPDTVPNPIRNRPLIKAN